MGQLFDADFFPGHREWSDIPDPSEDDLAFQILVANGILNVSQSIMEVQRVHRKEATDWGPW
eukprot:CAMPEP_0196251302 /NCGR_PEP_ID=MMETSP0913-20130531/47147_1 /TAXON_ID=49265 /ORGANISM="Thalassiosira rotula, Strain GSO102" /LENGTH=61 /DNA_ID=CAMNT_0041537507 /DNA_START=90 /DNA_END=275 /DNA_ORIENTATION=+